MLNKPQRRDLDCARPGRRATLARPGAQGPARGRARLSGRPAGCGLDRARAPHERRRARASPRPSELRNSEGIPRRGAGRLRPERGAQYEGERPRAHTGGQAGAPGGALRRSARPEARARPARRRPLARLGHSDRGPEPRNSAALRADRREGPGVSSVSPSARSSSAGCLPATTARSATRRSSPCAALSGSGERDRDDRHVAAWSCPPSSVSDRLRIARPVSASARGRGRPRAPRRVAALERRAATSPQTSSGCRSAPSSSRGCSGRASVRQPRSRRRTLIAATLSLSIEFAQLYEDAPVASLADSTCNTVGAFSGGWLAIAIARTRGHLYSSPFAGLLRHPVAAALVFSWVGYRLSPFAFVLDRGMGRSSPRRSAVGWHRSPRSSTSSPGS